MGPVPPAGASPGHTMSGATRALQPNLAGLLQQIADLVSAGEDSGSQASDGSVPIRLRTVVLSLLDQVAANATGESPMRGFFYLAVDTF